MFSVSYRDHVRDHVLQLAASDSRVVAGAIVGSLALSEGDRWSDLDLTFAVADEFSMHDVLEEWTRGLVEEFDAAHLFDLPQRALDLSSVSTPRLPSVRSFIHASIKVWRNRPKI